MKKHVHFIGIGGTGLSAIARVLLEKGYLVSGSDRELSPLARALQAEGVHVVAGHDAANIKGADMVIRSSAIPDDNPEVEAARAANIPVFKRADFLGQLMSGHTTVAISGSHGKTTTTSMIAWMLSAMGCDPSFISGGVLNNLGTNARSGKGAHFVIEADEYDRMFLGLKPDVAVITNMEYDHPDCYPTPAAYRQAFEAFIAQMPSGGVLIAFGDDPACKGLADFAEQSSRRAVTYGVEVGNVYQARRWSVNQRGGFDYAAWKALPDRPEALLCRVSLQVPGIHNVYNSLAALAVAETLGLSVGEAARALGEYSGSGRRFEILGQVGGVTVIDDYAHHPTEIQATLAAARARYPGKRIWAVWQPHTYSRTQALLKEFRRSFVDADQVIVTEIYASREPKQDFSSAQIVAEMIHPAAHFISTLDETGQYLIDHLKSGDVMLVLSAGDANQMSARVYAALQERRS